jgi:hypothetical protein
MPVERISLTASIRDSVPTTSSLDLVQLKNDTTEWGKHNRKKGIRAGAKQVWVQIPAQQLSAEGLAALAPVSAGLGTKGWCTRVEGNGGIKKEKGDTTNRTLEQKACWEHSNVTVITTSVADLDYLPRWDSDSDEAQIRVSQYFLIWLLTNT